MRVLFFSFLSVLSCTSNGALLRECNEPIRVVTINEIERVASWLLNTTPQAQGDLKALAIHIGAINYDILVSKVCGSCDQFSSDFENAKGWEEFCGDDVYGHDAPHSALVMHPINPETGEPVTAELNGFINMMSSRLFRDQAPTVNFPDTDFITFLQENEKSFLQATLIDLIVPMVAASAGTTAIVPDYLGFGQSGVSYTMSYLYPTPIQQSTIVSYLAAERFTSFVTDGYTTMNRTVTIAGYSLGGYSMMPASVALQQTLGINIHAMFQGATPIDPSIAASGVLASSIAGIPISDPPSVGFLSLLLHTFSSELLNFVPSAGTDQILASPLWLDSGDNSKNINYWFSPEANLNVTELYGILPPGDPESIASLWNPAYSELVVRSLVEFNGTIPACIPPLISNKTELLCQALISANGLQYYAILKENNVPISYCHSQSDRVAPFDPFALMILSTGAVTPYQPPISGFSTSNHYQAHALCNSGPLNFFTTDNGNFNAMTPRCGGKESKKEGKKSSKKGKKCQKNFLRKN